MGYIKVSNWEIYQARTDKDLPWFKLWSRFFDRLWWQELEDKFKIVPIIFLNTARKFNNKCPDKLSYYQRIYNLKLSEEEMLFVCKLLKDEGFLFDLPVGQTSDCSTLVLSNLNNKTNTNTLNSKKSFEDFWELYPKKRSKGQAEKAWKNIKPDEQLHDRIFRALEQAKTSAEWKKDGGQFIPYPASWLNAKGWEDELQIPTGQSMKKPDPNCGFCRGTGKARLKSDPSVEVSCGCWK